MRLSAKTDMGHTRTENQDDYRASLQGRQAAWAVVCDGMGGAAGGSIASALAVGLAQQQCAAMRLADSTPQEDAQAACQLIQLANAKVYQAAAQDAALFGMGTTMVVALVHDGVCALAWAGDSRAYLYRDGMLRQLTRDHSMVQELVEKGVITIEEAAAHPRKNVITRAVGVHPQVEPETLLQPVQPGDILLLCTDGLTNAVPLPEIEGVLHSTPFYECANGLIERVLLRAEQDNATVVLLEID